MTEPVYLGDSVYYLWDGYSFELTTRNGLPTDPSNTITLEPEVLKALFTQAATDVGRQVLIDYLGLKP